MTFGDFIKEKEKIDDVLDLTLPSLSDGHAYPTFTIKLDNIGKVSFHFGGTISSLDMLYDSLPERIKSEPDFIKMVNIGSVGDVKSQNLPRNTNND